MSLLLPSSPTIHRFAGTLIGPDDEGYDKARRVYNGMVDRYPALIARCESVADVAAALRHAREHGMEIAVRAGAHAAPGFATSEGGMVIDLGPLKAIHVDPVRRIAWVQPGVVWGELDAATQEHGLAVTGGRVSSTGVAGFTLGSGSGWLERKMGLAADNLRAARVVTATATWSPRPRPRTRTSSGRSAAAAATSASWSSSSSRCAPSARSCSAGCCCGRAAAPARSCAPTAT